MILVPKSEIAQHWFICPIPCATGHAKNNTNKGATARIFSMKNTQCAPFIHFLRLKNAFQRNCFVASPVLALKSASLSDLLPLIAPSRHQLTKLCFHLLGLSIPWALKLLFFSSCNCSSSPGLLYSAPTFPQFYWTFCNASAEIWFTVFYILII